MAPEPAEQTLDSMLTAAVNPAATALTVKLTNNHTYITHIRSTDGREVRGASMILSPEELEQVIDAFDPDGSIRARSNKRKVVDFALYG